MLLLLRLLFVWEVSFVVFSECVVFFGVLWLSSVIAVRFINLGLCVVAASPVVLFLPVVRVFCVCFVRCCCCFLFVRYLSCVCVIYTHVCVSVCAWFSRLLLCLVCDVRCSFSSLLFLVCDVFAS